MNRVHVSRMLLQFLECRVNLSQMILGLFVEDFEHLLRELAAVVDHDGFWRRDARRRFAVFRALVGRPSNLDRRVHLA